MSKGSSEAINGFEKEWRSQQRPLIERLCGGDSDAIVEFVMQYQQHVRSVAMDVLMDADLAGKATHATFRTAITQLQNGVETRQVEPWLLWIARNEALALTQVASQKQKMKADEEGDTQKPVQVGTKEPEGARYAADLNDADRAAAEVEGSAGHRAARDAWIMSFLGRDTPRYMKGRETQMLADDTVPPRTAEASYVGTPRAAKVTQTAESVEWAASGEKGRRANLLAEERAEAEESIQNTIDSEPLAQDDAQWRIENRERKRLQGLETENSMPGERAKSGTDGELRSEKATATVGDVLLTAGMSIVALLLIWIVFGLLSKNGVLNLPDIGYSWFNENIFYIF